ncbi:hypothetical protein N7448_009731 [Penicillium atrosanguineum]|uniref:uncharacterized protein n=1 Tax=Penicillium atrosanguineum TaxID=1132637 RepID=UPI0023A207A1|nr:uncharacterized protein N7443_006981 [Penicillium atrosanguineum]KAJ5123634.1 hypothetical protein N7448_009731 [Penicillium atrosanguineum]KAJ5142262.1 hypothetical protein N7526_003257 [Penicillium atrosanguineum]KAJ5298861.1 hypothetical protein N7443_006981 [Penicillium atrosanguineum]
MAPSKVTTMSASSPLPRKRKDRADSPSSSNDTASVPAAPTKTIQTTNGTNGTNGNGVSALKASNDAKELITHKPALNAKYDVSKKTESVGQTVARNFDCVKHARPAGFPEYLGALPFPRELKGLVAWTDAFVERLGWVAMQEQEETARRERSLGRANRDIELLSDRNTELKTKLHLSTDEIHKLKGNNARLDSRNKFLEGQCKRDNDHIKALTKNISEQGSKICTLTQENEKLRTSVKSLEVKIQELIDQHTGDEASRKALTEGFAEWKRLDKVHDDKVNAQVADLQKELHAERVAKAKAHEDLKEAVAKYAKLEGENAHLETLRAELDVVVKTIREQLKQLEAGLAASEGEKATLNALLHELKKKEESAQVEIESLHGQLHDAKLSVEAAMEQVHAANEHAKSHWGTLQTIRMDGGWLRTDEKDACDLFLNDPIMCSLPVSKPVVAPMKTVIERLPESQPAADIENPFN